MEIFNSFSTSGAVMSGRDSAKPISSGSFEFLRLPLESAIHLRFRLHQPVVFLETKIAASPMKSMKAMSLLVRSIERRRSRAICFAPTLQDGR